MKLQRVHSVLPSRDSALMIHVVIHLLY